MVWTIGTIIITAATVWALWYKLFHSPHVEEQFSIWMANIIREYPSIRNNNGIVEFYEFIGRERVQSEDQLRQLYDEWSK